MDQVRAAIFSSLGERVVDARVLDLFAGTGSLGIEALSRGAAAATFVERDRRAVDCLRDNLAKARLDPATALVRTADAFDFLTRAAASGDATRYHLVFADPPYAKDPGDDDAGARLLVHAGLARLVEPVTGLFVLEKAPGRPLAPCPGWEVTRQKRYGGTEVVFLARPE